VDVNRLAGLLAGGVLVLPVLGCGSSDDDSASPPALTGSPATTTVGDSETRLFATESGLECPQDLFETGQYEPGMADPGAGFAGLDAAAADYWSNGDGKYRSDRTELTEIVDPPVVRYDNERGETQLILSFVQIDDRWLLDSTEACSYAPAGPPGRAIPDVRDRPGAVVSARLLVPEELPSYESLRVELDEGRFPVMQPGEIGFDAVIVFRSTPQCGNLPELDIDGDASALHVSIQTPISGDCDAVEYDRVIGLDLESGFEQTPIVAD
jgi:hypothetical protein